MRLAKPAFDVGLSTNWPDEHERFWREVAGLTLDGRLPVSADQTQLRFCAGASIVKVNSFATPLAPVAASGFRELLLADGTITAPVRLEAPDGVQVRRVPPGYRGVRQLGFILAARDPAGLSRFYGEAMGLPEEAPGCFRAGESLLFIEPAHDAPAAGSGAGWRYITFQIFKADKEHARALAAGAREARAPTTLGDVARFSIIRDPEGNAIELSQRAALVGSLE